MKVALLLCAVLAGTAPLVDSRSIPETKEKAPFPFYSRLTTKQVATLEGVWELASARDQRRLDGSIFDGLVLDALNSKKPLSIEEHLLEQEAKATENESSTLLNFKLIIPSVDKRTGMFAAYKINMHVNSSGPGAWQPGSPITEVKRFVGAATALPDGSLTWQAVEDVDTATYQAFIPASQHTTMDILRLEGAEVWAEDGSHTLDDESVVEIQIHKTDKSVLAELEKLKGSLPLKTVRAVSAHS